MIVLAFLHMFLASFWLGNAAPGLAAFLIASVLLAPVSLIFGRFAEAAGLTILGIMSAVVLYFSWQWFEFAKQDLPSWAAWLVVVTAAMIYGFNAAVYCINSLKEALHVETPGERLLKELKEQGSPDSWAEYQRAVKDKHPPEQIRQLGMKVLDDAETGEPETEDDEDRFRPPHERGRK